MHEKPQILQTSGSCVPVCVSGVLIGPRPGARQNVDEFGVLGMESDRGLRAGGTDCGVERWGELILLTTEPAVVAVVTEVIDGFSFSFKIRSSMRIAAKRVCSSGVTVREASVSDDSMLFTKNLKKRKS